MSHFIDFQMEDARWQRIPKLKSELEKAVTTTQALLPTKVQFPFTVTLLLSNDKTIRRLNRDFRGKDQSTNVLSFPQFEPSQLGKKGSDKELVELGDITMGYQYIVAEAKKDHKILINHIIHLFIHGLLHLFGYDHMSHEDANRMERLEKKIMAKLKRPDPYHYDVAVRPKAKSAKARQAPRTKDKPRKKKPYP